MKIQLTISLIRYIDLFWSILNFAEKIGDDSTSFIEPDIWVDPDEAEEKAVLFMKYYQIGQEE